MEAPPDVMDTLQMGVMEEKVKLSNMKNLEATGSLPRKYQELLQVLQCKDELIRRLEAQLEAQVRAGQQQAQHTRHPAPVPVRLQARWGYSNCGRLLGHRWSF